MAAQPDRSPVNMSSDFDAPAVTPTLVLPAPMTPVLTTGLDFKTLYDNCDPFHRRPQPDIPFFTEPDAEGRDGPLPTSFGPLIDLTQIAEAAGVGWDDSPPLTDKGVGLVLDFVLQSIVSEDKPLTFIARLATDFSMLQFIIEQTAARATVDVPFRRGVEQDDPPPYSIHHLLTWLLEHGYVLSNIQDGIDGDGYFHCELFRLSQLQADTRETLLQEVEAFHCQHTDQMMVCDVALLTHEQGATKSEDVAMCRMKMREALRAEFSLLLKMLRGESAEYCQEQKRLAALLADDALRSAQHFAKNSPAKSATAADDKSSAGMNTARLLQEVQIGADDAVTTTARSHQFSESLFDSVTPMEETAMAAQNQSPADMNTARFLQEVQIGNGNAVTAAARSRQFSESLFDSVTPMEETGYLAGRKNATIDLGGVHGRLADPSMHEAYFAGRAAVAPPNFVDPVPYSTPLPSSMAGVRVPTRDDVPQRQPVHAPLPSSAAGMWVPTRDDVPQRQPVSYRPTSSSVTSSGIGMSEEQEAMAIQERFRSLPKYLHMSKQHTVSVSHGVKQEIIDLIKIYSGTDDPSLRDWVMSIADAVLRIPNGADDASLKPYLMFISVDGAAKDVLRIENLRLVSQGKSELHARPDNGDAIMDLMCRHFFREPMNTFLLHFAQLVRSCWRDARAPQESLLQYHSRMLHHQREAAAYYDNTVTVLPELTARLLFVAGLPTEIQSIVTTQKAIRWDDPDLDGQSLEQLYDMIFTEYELREKRCESLTPQQRYCDYPDAVLDKRTASLTQAAAVVTDTAAAEPGVIRRSNKPKRPPVTVTEYQKKLRAADIEHANQGPDTLKELCSKPDSRVLDAMLDIFKEGTGVSGGPMRLIRTFRALLADGSNNFETYPQMAAVSSKHQLIFHCLMTVLFANGRVKVRGQKGPGRMTVKPMQALPLDEDGRGLDDVVPADEIDKLLKIPPANWRQSTALALQAKHYLRVEGSMKPVCYVCGAFGHQCGECLLHLQVLHKKGDISSIPAVSGTQYRFGQAVTTVCSSELYEMTCDADLKDPPAQIEASVVTEAIETEAAEQENDTSITDCFDVNAQSIHVPRQIITLYLGPQGIPFKTMIDSGAARSMGKKKKLAKAGLKLVKLLRQLFMRLADDKIADKAITEAVQSCAASALNGDIHVQLPELLAVDSLPNCDLLLGRDVIFGVLKAIIHADRLECFCTSDSGPTDILQRKCIPFEYDTPVCGVDPVSVNLYDCGPIDEITLVSSVMYEEYRSAAIEEFTAAAALVKPKSRNREQRQALALQKQRRNAMFDSGPLPTGATVVTAPTRTNDGINSRMKSAAGVCSRVGRIMTVALMMLSGMVTEGEAATPDAGIVTCTAEEIFAPSMPCNDTINAFMHTAMLDAKADEECQIAADFEKWYQDMGINNVELQWAGTADASEMTCETDGIAVMPSACDGLTETINSTAVDVDQCGAESLSDAERLSLPITREVWYPLLRYEALTRPGGIAVLRRRLKQQGHDVPSEKIRQALDVIDPQVVDSKFEFPEECNRQPTVEDLESKINVTWQYLKNWAESVQSNSTRFTCLQPIVKYDPPADHPRCKFHLKEGLSRDNLPRMRGRPVAFGHREIVTQFAKMLISQGRWKPSSSPIASSLLCIPKPQKDPLDPPKYRLVSDYRHCNDKVIKHESARLPTCDQLWYSLDKAKIISTCDALDGYWLAPLDPQTSWITAVDTPIGRYEWTCLPMGIQPASGFYQSFLEGILMKHNLLYTSEGMKAVNASGVPENYVSVYQDDLIWWSDDPEVHKLMTERLLDVFSSERLFLNPKKMHLGCQYARYLGCVIGNSSLCIDPQKVKAVNQMKVPSNATEVRSLIGAAQFFRRWIPGFSTITAPLTDMLKKGVNFNTDFGQKQLDAVQDLKTAMTTSPCLAMYDPSKPCICLVDASTIGIGGCLAQEHDGHLRPVSYSSHRLTASERKWPITELEGLAVLHFVRVHRHFLINNPFTIRILSDHKALQWVQSIDTASGRVARWMLELAQYDFRIEFIPGCVNDVADGLSRLLESEPNASENGIEFRDYLREQETVQAIDVSLSMPEFSSDWEAAGVYIEKLHQEDDHLREFSMFADPLLAASTDVEAVSTKAFELREQCNTAAYERCPQFSSVLRTLRSNSRHNEAAGDRKMNDTGSSPLVMQSQHNGTAGDVNSVTEENGNAATVVTDATKKTKSGVPARMLRGMYTVNDAIYTVTGRLCVPTALRQQLIAEMHTTDSSTHRGADQLLLHLQRRFYWPGMQRDVDQYVADCDVCKECKSATHKHWGDLRPHMPPTQPFTHYSIDFMFGFPSDGGGPLRYDGILCCVDMFSKRVIAIPVWEASPAEVIADQFYRQVVCNRGVPLAIVSDRDGRFCQDFWRKLWALHRTSLKMTPAYSQHADGQTERMNRLLQEVMRANVQADQCNWLELLDGACMTINNAPFADGRPSPFEIESGQLMKVPLDLQPLMDQTWPNRGAGQLVRETMVYDDDNVLLDVAPYPAIYEYHHQRRYEYDHPERIRAIHQLAYEQMVQAKTRMAETENANRPARMYQVGDYVKLKLDHIQLPVWSVSKCKKLRGKYFGSFPVVAVHSPLAIELRLPKWMHANIHPVFHPMYLQLASTSTVQKNLKATLGDILAPAEYGVDRILAHRVVRGVTEYLVQWEGCSYLQSTYEPESNLTHAQAKLTTYQNKRRQIETDVASVIFEDPWRNGATRK